MAKHYEDQIVQQALRFGGGWPKGVTLDELTRLHGELARLLDGRKRPPKRWPLRLARLARVYLDERAQARAVESFESLMKLRSQAQQSPGGIQVTQMTRNRHA